MKRRAEHATYLEALESRVLLSNTLIPSFNNADIIPDPLRNRVYFTHNTATVDRYDLTTNTFLTPWTLASPVSAADITLDGAALYLADASAAALHKIDLATDAIADIAMPNRVFSLITLPDNTLLFNYTYNIDPWGAYHYDPVGGGITSAGAPGHGMLLADATHHFAAATLAGSPNHIHLFTDGALTTTFDVNTFGLKSNIASVSPDGARIADATT
jgi:hypothetical protein